MIGKEKLQRNREVGRSCTETGKPDVEVKDLAFINTFLSYLLVLAVIAVLAGVAVSIGIRLRKNKNRQPESK